RHTRSDRDWSSDVCSSDLGTVEGAYRFVVDFAGKKIESLPEDTVLRGVVTVASGDETAQLLDQQVVKNPVTGGWRLTFQIKPLQIGRASCREREGISRVRV